MHQPAFITTQLGQRSAGNGRELVGDPTRGLEEVAPFEARRDPTAGAESRPTAGAPASLLSDPTRGLEDQAQAAARRDPMS
jgi:hypothetical protein